MGGLVKSIFGGSDKSPAPVPLTPAPPPVVEDAGLRAQEAADQMRRRRGRAATILSADESKAGASSVGTKTLLGA